MRLNCLQFDGKTLSGQPLPVYMILGDEPFLVRKTLKQIMEFLLQGRSADDPSVLRIDGNSAKADHLVVELRSDSLFGGRRVVVIDGVEGLAKAEGKKLLEYLSHPVTSSTLVLVALAEAEGRKNVRQFLQELADGVDRTGMVIECPRPRAKEMNSLVRRELERIGLKPTDEGVHYLMELLGENLSALEAAIEKLYCFLGPQGVVGQEQVALLVHGSSQATIFQLTDAIGQKAPSQAIRVLGQLLEQGESPLGILSMLIRHLRQLLQVSGLAARGHSQMEIQKILGIPSFVVSKYLEQARKHSRWHLWRMLLHLELADSELKTTTCPPYLKLERMVRELISSVEKR